MSSQINGTIQGNGHEAELSLEDVLPASALPSNHRDQAQNSSVNVVPVSVSVPEDGLKITPVAFPPEVESALASLLPSEDPLDQPDFSTVDYINTLFPTEQSLTNLDDVIEQMRFKVQCVDEDIRKIVRNQTHVGQDAAHALEEAQEAIVLLFSQIREIKQKAGESEAMVRDITRDIKQLDTAKRNLTTAITTLNHLHMLVGGVSTLRGLSLKREYGQVANLLQGLMEVMDHFKSYTDIPQIKELSDEVKTIREDLGQQIVSDFQSALSDENAHNFVPSKKYAEACLVVDVLEPPIKKTLIKWLIDRELVEYQLLFTDFEETSWLDKIDSRYSWLKKHLIEFEQRLGPMFPPAWEMSERIAIEFCQNTKFQLDKLMMKRRNEIDTKLLLHSIQRTVAFESLLGRRFIGLVLKEIKEAKAIAANKIDDPSNPFYVDVAHTETSEKESQNEGDQDPNGASSPFAGLISECFEPYLDIYIESQDRNLADLVDRAAQDQRTKGCANAAIEGSAVLHSCGDLFMFYKKCMMQCSQLSTRQPLLALANVFKKYLRDYATRVLLASLPKASNSSAPSSLSASVASISKDLKDFSTTGLIQNFQSFLKEGDAIKLTNDERVLTCTILVTSEYCLETTQQLEGKLKEKITSNLSSQINMGPEQDVYHSVINSCIQLLVQDLDAHCDPALTTMTKMSWASIEGVGDQSAYVTSLANHMKQSIPLIRDNLSSSKKYFTQFCVKFVNAFIPRFIQHLFRCKPISTLGAEQLLLDTHSVKTLLLDLPSLGSSVSSRKAPASYTKIVIKGMTRAEMTLKVVMSPSEPRDGFVEQYVKLVPDVDIVEFQKVLEMKGIRKVDQTQYMDHFKTTVPQNAGTSVLSPGPRTVNRAEESRIKKLENLIKKRL